MFHTACVAVGGAAREAMQKFKEPKWGNDASDLRRASHGEGTEEDTQAFEFEVRWRWFMECQAVWVRSAVYGEQVVVVPGM